jgi:1-deoxy-D-xylulose-5-phosphate synthase
MLRPETANFLPYFTANSIIFCTRCTLEENVASGGYGEAVASYMKQSGYDNELYLVAIPDRFIEHGSVPQLMEEIQMDAPCIAKGILERIR